MVNRLEYVEEGFDWICLISDFSPILERELIASTKQVKLAKIKTSFLHISSSIANKWKLLTSFTIKSLSQHNSGKL